MNKTVKPYTTKEVSALDLFGTKPLGLTSSEVNTLKRGIVELAQKRGNKIDFFTSSGITFYATYMKDITVLCDIKSKVKQSKISTWKFGFVDRITGKINLLFGGHTVADKESAKDIFKIASEVVKLRFQENNELIPFSIQNEKTNDH